MAQQPPPQPYRLRTITVYVELDKIDEAAAKEVQAALESGGAGAGASAAAAAVADAHADRLWGEGLQETGEFLARAKQHFEREIPGLEVQTVRAASQLPFSNLFGLYRPGDDPVPFAELEFPPAGESHVAALAAALERSARRAGVSMLSLGAVVCDPAGVALRHVPAVIEATESVSCSFEALLRRGDLGYGREDHDQEDDEGEEAYASITPSLRLAAATAIEVARRTGGRGNFRFAIAAGCNADGGSENGFSGRRERAPCPCGERKYMSRERGTEPSLRPVPFFPVAGGCPAGWSVWSKGADSPSPVYFALGCETDGLLRGACERVRAAFEGTSAADKAARCAGRVTVALKAALAKELKRTINPLRKAALALDSSERERMKQIWHARAAAQRQGQGGRPLAQGWQHAFEEQGYGAYSEPWGFCGIDTSVAPGLDTPSLTGSFELLLPLLARDFLAGGGAGGGGPAAAGPSSSSSPSPPPPSSGPRFGDPGTLALCSAVTRALQSPIWDLDSENPDDDMDDVPAEPPTTAGFCGLMLAVLEDAGLAEAAREGRLTVEKLLAWSSVCGTGLDTVPVPGPRWRVSAAPALPSAAAAAAAAAAPSAAAAGGSKRPRIEEEEEQEDEAAAKAHDDALVGRIACVAADVCAMALRLRKPLSVRLLPLPMLRAGDETARALGGHPYLLDSAVMAL